MAVATSTALLLLGGAAAAGGVVSSLVSADASRDAAREQRKALASAQEANELGFQRADATLQPFLESGTQSFNQLSDIVRSQAGNMPQFSFGAEDIQNAPGIQFAQDQARKQIEASAAARGSSLGAGTLQKLQDRSFGLSSLQANDVFNRKLSGFQQNQSSNQLGLSNLANIAQTGPQMAINLSNNAIGQAGRAGDLGIQLGNVNAAEQVAQGQAVNQGIGAVTGGVQNALLLQSLMSGNPTGVASGGVLPQGAGDLNNLNRNLA